MRRRQFASWNNHRTTGAPICVARRIFAYNNCVGTTANPVRRLFHKSDQPPALLTCRRLLPSCALITLDRAAEIKGGFFSLPPASPHSYPPTPSHSPARGPHMLKIALHFFDRTIHHQLCAAAYPRRWNAAPSQNLLLIHGFGCQAAGRRSAYRPARFRVSHRNRLLS